MNNNLTHYSPVLLIIPPENIRKTRFSSFSGAIDKQHRAVMGKSGCIRLRKIRQNTEIYGPEKTLLWHILHSVSSLERIYRDDARANYTLSASQM